jgi:hypothetical protein
LAVNIRLAANFITNNFLLFVVKKCHQEAKPLFFRHQRLKNHHRS